MFVGDDWAEDHHDIEIVDDTGQVLTRRRLPEGLEGITRLHALIAERMPAQWADLEPGQAAAMVKVGIESDRGPWVAALIITGYVRDQPDVGRPLPATAFHLGREVRHRRRAPAGRDRPPGPGTPPTGRR